MRTNFKTKEEALASRRWVVVDAAELPVGRLASRIVALLRGKHKPTYTPHADDGDFVVVINADKVRFTGRKLEQKLYRSHSGFPGGLKEVQAAKLLAEKPERVLESAVHGMLPRGPLGYQMRRKLKIYAGPEHPHQAQQPEHVSL